MKNITENVVAFCHYLNVSITFSIGYKSFFSCVFLLLLRFRVIESIPNIIFVRVHNSIIDVIFFFFVILESSLDCDKD